MSTGLPSAYSSSQRETVRAAASAICGAKRSTCRLAKMGCTNRRLRFHSPSLRSVTSPRPNPTAKRSYSALLM
ncbi:Uncharacterised protein [Mycobacteroides abscessus subsp. abscessus]|nr:Uncharacterised protein [Mycobacteroides abscessus subsp. abscessus]